MTHLKFMRISYVSASEAAAQTKQRNRLLASSNFPLSLFLFFSFSSNSFSLHLQCARLAEKRTTARNIAHNLSGVSIYHISPSSGLGCNSTPCRRLRLHIIIIIIIFFSAASALFADNWRRCLSPSLSLSPCASLCHHKAKKNNLTTRQ